MFQSTHPHRVRQKGTTKVVAMPRFNPRTRIGCDLIQFTLKGSIWCFNPRTRIGCDIGIIRPRCGICSFNPRTRIGCDVGYGERGGKLFVSIHAPA